VLGAAIVVQMMTAPGQTVGMSVFVDHLIDDLNLTRSSVSTAYLIGTLTGALTMAAAGRFIDSRGVRRAVGVFGAGFGIVLVAMSGVTSFVTLAVGFVGARALGQGALTLTASTAVAVNFDRRRGTAMGILAGVGGASMSLTPLVATGLIAWIGWRLTWVALAVAVWMVLLPIASSRLFADRAGRAVPQDEFQTGGKRWTAGDVRRSPAFWVVTAAVALAALVSTALAFHHMALLTQRGLSPTAAAAIFLPQTLAAAGAAVAAGSLADRVSERGLFPGALSLLAVAPLMVLHVTPGVSAVAYGMVLGAGMSSIRAVEATVLPRWFGLAHIGEIRGIIMAATVAGSALGPLQLALADEHLGGFAPALAMFACAALVLATIAAATRPPDASPTYSG
jgi:MFS family permease